MQPHYISMIMPARWYAGGIGLNDFRNEMLNDPHLIRLTDFVNSKDCFSTVDIAGGYKHQRSGTPYHAAQSQ